MCEEVGVIAVASEKEDKAIVARGGSGRWVTHYTRSIQGLRMEIEWYMAWYAMFGIRTSRYLRIYTVYLGGLLQPRLPRLPVKLQVTREYAVVCVA